MTYTAKKLLKNKAHFFMVHRPDRLFEILESLQKNHLAPKRIQFVYPKAGEPANVLLIDAIKDGALTGATILPPIVTHNDDDTYTKAVWDIYEGKSND